ncbi:hypothetical protein BDZ85DRAFT_209615 [Elsinoe ampelina]|uniref:BSD domain-containing protein n=1 Tax=Elsinoe ampelina TaxID=302913 RepID=A0A6A6GPD9_9PEZI|nr:hypothetical protein BDZ85DRAFT_209615 [Elsinoe ampelina]
MDVAYDHIQEEALAVDESGRAERKDGDRPAGLNAEFQEAFKAVSASPWGARLGGLWGSVRAQGETLYTNAQQEVAHVSTQATRGLTDLQSNLASRARGISLSQPPTDSGATSFSDPTFALPASPTKTIRATDASSPMVSRFRLEAASRLKDIQKAEDAADEALLKFGSNMRSFFRDAVTVTAPEQGAEEGTKREVLFETNDSEGKRVFHSSRFDAQMHVIVSRQESFLKDPESGEWEGFWRGFDVEGRTEEVARELERYEELRRVFGGLVPEKVEYAVFWGRYFFLKGVVEEEERRRKEVLKGATADDGEEVGWGDEEEEEDESSTPVNDGKTNPASQSTTTLTPPKADEGAEKSPRRSNEDDKKSTADSDASYDIVSGATSKTPSSPKEAKKDDSDDEDWE